MAKDHLERKTYRKSPGRQYGYDYDPLRSQGREAQRDEMTSRSGALLSQRPDPRRTRQLMRQSIIASKRINDEETEPVDFLFEEHYPQRRSSQDLYTPEDTYERAPSRAGQRYIAYEAGEEEYMATASDTSDTSKARRYSSRAGRFDEPALPHTSELLPEEMYPGDPYAENDWRPLDVGPTAGIEDAYRHDYAEEEYDDEFVEEPLPRSSQSMSTRSRRPKPTRQLPPEYPPEDESYDYDYEEEHPSVRPGRQKKKISRRGLLLGAGIAAVAGVGVAAYEVAPKVPAAVNNATTNLEHQVQEAFNKGLEQGAEQARREFVTALDNLEGFTLEGAIAAARLTRVAYDVFVSPVVRLGSALTGDFLNGMLKAFKTAREWLAGVYQDNATLIAIQKVLEAWVAQVSTMPKQLDAITQADLDGAQAYLRALQRKIEDEKNKLNKPQNQASQSGKQATPGASAQPTQIPKK